MCASWEHDISPLHQPFFLVKRSGQVVRCCAGKTDKPGFEPVLARLSLVVYGHVIVTLPITINQTANMAHIAAHLKAQSFCWWQCVALGRYVYFTINNYWIPRKENSFWFHPLRFILSNFWQLSNWLLHLQHNGKNCGHFTEWLHKTCLRTKGHWTWEIV